MTHLEDQKKIALLEQYVDTLERQNYAKNGETTLLYEQLESLRQENEMLKDFIEATKNKWEEQKQALTQQLRERENEQVVSSRNFGDELRNSVDMNSLKAVAEDMRLELTQREEQMVQLCQEKQDLQIQVQNLKQQLAQTTCKMTKSQEKLRSQLQIVKQLQNEIFGLRNSRSETSRTGISFAKLEVDKLVKQNNELIEKIRLLEKEKNGYYNELKMASPLKVRGNHQQNKSAQKRSQGQVPGKSERWNLMQEKLRAIRNENQQLKANLAIH